MNVLIGIGVNGVSYGMVLFIISIGLSIMMGLMRFVNLAHGTFAMVGGYLASALLHAGRVAFAVAVVAGVAGTVVLALPLERLLFARLYRRSDTLTQILMTIGITFVIIGATNYWLGPSIQPIPLPPWLSRSVAIGTHRFAVDRLLISVLGVALAGALWLLLERSTFGMLLRATIDNPDMAEALGVRTTRIYVSTFAVSAALSAFGGIMGAELLPIEPYYGLRYMVLFLVVVSIGGAGSILGALVASLALGMVATIAAYVAPSYGDFVLYAFVVVLVFCVPNGVFGRAPA